MHFIKCFLLFLISSFLTPSVLLLPSGSAASQLSYAAGVKEFVLLLFWVSILFLLFFFVFFIFHICLLRNFFLHILFQKAIFLFIGNHFFISLHYFFLLLSSCLQRNFLVLYTVLRALCVLGGGRGGGSSARNQAIIRPKLGILQFK